MKLNERTIGKFVFATAAERPFLKMAFHVISSLQQHFPGHRIIFVDLGDLTLGDVAVVGIKLFSFVLISRITVMFVMYPANT